MSQRKTTSNLTELLTNLSNLCPTGNYHLYYHGEEPHLPFLLEGDIPFVTVECLWGGEENLASLPWDGSKSIHYPESALQTFLHKAADALCSEVMQKWQTYGELSPSICKYQTSFRKMEVALSILVRKGLIHEVRGLFNGQEGGDSKCQRGPKLAFTVSGGSGRAGELMLQVCAACGITAFNPQEDA